MNTVCDVLVVGAGVAGASAAVAAARGGVRTILIEKERYLGGTGYAGMFQHICGLYLNSEAVPTETLNRGLVREISARLSRTTPGRTVKKIGQVYVLPFSRDELQSVFTALCSEEKNVATLSGHTAVAVAMEHDAVRDVTVEGSRGTQVIVPKMVIDCSGSGTVAAMAGAAYELAPRDERQLAGYVVRIKGLKNVDENLLLKVPYHLAHAAARALIAPASRFTTFSPGDTADEGYCKMSIDSDNEHGEEERARAEADAMVAYLRSVIPEFEDSSIAGTSLKVLEREGRRIIGDYTLTKEDVLSARKFPDGVVKNAWPIELWARTRGTKYSYVPRGDYYEIPFRCLAAKGISNLLTAGRCISVSHEALGSTRVMGTCMSLGEQAGKAAAYRVKNGTYPDNIKDY